jgi:poly(glycerol-phosphate) alpha-glucosyltransferase
MRAEVDNDQAIRKLPQGRHFAVTWSLPTEFAGRTNAMLHRARAFGAQGGTPVDILTFDDFRNYSSVRAELAATGHLSEDTRVLNLWDDLPDMSAKADAGDSSGHLLPFLTPLSGMADIHARELEGPHRRLACCRSTTTGRTAPSCCPTGTTPATPGSTADAP